MADVVHQVFSGSSGWWAQAPSSGITPSPSASSSRAPWALVCWPVLGCAASDLVREGVDGSVGFQESSETFEGAPKLHCFCGQITVRALVLFPVVLWRPAE